MQGGRQTFVWEGKGGGARGRHRNDFSPSHLLCAINIQMGAMPPGLPIVTPLAGHLIHHLPGPATGGTRSKPLMIFLFHCFKKFFFNYYYQFF